MRTRLTIILTVVGLAAFASSAVAAPVSYTMQTGSRSSKDAIALDGDQLIAFHTSAVPTSCPDGHQISGDDSFEVVLSGPVQLNAGQFEFSGRARPSYYSSSDPSQGADFTVTGSVTPDNRVITGTVAISNATDPFVTDCSGSFSFLAIPTLPNSDRGPAEKADFTSQFVYFNYRAGVVGRLHLQANFECGQSADAANIVGSDYGFGAIHASRDGRWEIHSFVFDEYQDIVELDVSGKIVGRKATGRIVVSEPPGLTSVARESCRGDYRWSAARPQPPAPPGPEAFFDWSAVRIAGGTTYRYYFLVSGISCTNSATAIRFVIAARSHVASCRNKTAWASGPLEPGRDYVATATALRMRNGRVTKRGSSITETLYMPAPGDVWVRLDRLPPPPSS